MQCVAVIPARYASSRLPGKALLEIGGKTIIRHVWERVKSCPLVKEVLIATDDERIFQAAESFGAKAVMTSPRHRSGTDRIAEAIADFDAEIVVNVQGDEPLISPGTIAETIGPLLKDDRVYMSTACLAMKNLDELFDPNCVKIILDSEGFALYFSRLPMPFHRVPGVTYETYRTHLQENPLLLKHFFKHVGIYAYQKDFLKIFVNLPESYLERLEQLEQLRAVEHGYRIKVVEVSEESFGIDTMEDYLRLKARLEQSSTF